MEDQDAAGGREEAAGPKCGAAAEEGDEMRDNPETHGEKDGIVEEPDQAGTLSASPLR